jgi:hypothetical protein
MARVTGPGGRIVLSAWIPDCAISASVRVAGEAIWRALGTRGGPPFAWHDRDALAGLLAVHGFQVEIEEHSHAFTAASVSEYVAAEFESHPLWVAGRPLLEARGEAEAVRDRVEAILEVGNEDPDGFRVTRRYVVATASRP